MAAHRGGGAGCRDDGPSRSTGTAPNRADKLKAVYLYNFGNYIDWPAKAFPNNPPDQQEFVIGVLGTKHPVHTVLKAIGVRKKVGPRKLKSVMIPDVKADWSCHVLFIPAACPEDIVNAALKKAKEKPILIVGESDNFASPDIGGHVQFFVQGAAIKFFIRPKAIAAQGMKAGARILQIGQVLDP